MSDNKSTSSGVGFTSLLLIAFIVLKLCNVITWSWLWVLSPFWIPTGIALLLLGAIGVIRFMEARKNKKIVTKSGQLKSKWEERLEKVQAAQRQRENQRALDEKLRKDA
jgi:hypothetical protein